MAALENKHIYFMKLFTLGPGHHHVFLFVLTPSLSVGFSVNSSVRFSGSSLLQLESSPTVLAQQSLLVPTELLYEAFPLRLVSMLIHAALLLLHLLLYCAQVIASLHGWKRGASKPRFYS